MTQYYFTRHGESQANVDNVFAGWMDSPLTEKGRKEALEEAQSLATEGLHFDLIISSPLSRAYDTARIVAEALGYLPERILLLDELKERSMGTYEGLPKESLRGQPNEIDAIAEAGGETRAEFATRVQRAIELIRSKSANTGKVLIVSHAGWHKMAVTVLEHKDVEIFHMLPSPQNNKVVPFQL